MINIDTVCIPSSHNPPDLEVRVPFNYTLHNIRLFNILLPHIWHTERQQEMLASSGEAPHILKKHSAS